MNRREAAEARFSAALDALEASVKESLAGAREAGNAKAEIALLRAERERLIARIAALEEETRALAGLTGEVEERLDGAIAEIREALARH
jgi:predicted  nucleic acid-binding Zn-ribbon protein